MRIYNLGIEKTGTSSLSGLLENNNSVHEYRFEETTKKIRQWKDGSITRDEFVNYIIDRETNRSEPFIDVSTFNHFYADILLDRFTDSKFILTIRDVESWFISEVNWISTINCRVYHRNEYSWLEDYMRIKQKGEYDMFIKIKKHDFEFDKKIKNNITKTLLNSSMIEDILDYYYTSNRKVIDLIPKERLLILDTNDISKSDKIISDFCCVPQDSLDVSRTRRNINKGKKKEQIGMLIDYFNYFENKGVSDRFNDLVTLHSNKSLK